MTAESSSQDLINEESQSLSPTAATNNVDSHSTTSLIAADNDAILPTTPQSTTRKRSAGPHENSSTKKSKVQEQKKTAIEANKKEVERIQVLAQSLEDQLKSPRLRTKVAVKECRPADFQRPLNEEHVKDLIQAHVDFKIRLHHQVIIIMPDLSSKSKYVIIDGQHRWKALKKLTSSKHQTSLNKSASGSQMPVENASELAYIEAILFDRNLTLEQQRTLANLADRTSGPSLPFSDVDLVKEAVHLRSTNSFFTGLKFTRRSVADNLQFFRAYNRRFQEYHILVAAIVDEEKRLPLVELMQAVMNGLFKKKNGRGNAMTNNVQIWRKIARIFNPTLESNAIIVREAITGSGTHLIRDSIIGDFDAMLEKLESEGSHVRQWLDAHDRKNVKVRDFCRKIGVGAVSLDNVYKFLNKPGFEASSDHDLASSARTFFGSLVHKNVYDLSLFLEKPFGTQFDFIYVDLRFFQSTIGKISSWLKTANCSMLLVRDYCKDVSDIGSDSPLNSFYRSNPSATAFVLNFDLPLGHVLRNSHLHAFSDHNVKNVLENVDFIHFEELFTGLLKDQMGLCFVGSTDAKACTPLLKNELHNFVFEVPDSNASGDDLAEISDDEP